MKKFFLNAIFLASTLLATEVTNKPYEMSADNNGFNYSLLASGELDVKEGFLTAKSCAENGTFKDCDLNKLNNETLVLFVHNDNEIFEFANHDEIVRSAFDMAANKNKVRLFGKIQENGTFEVAGLASPKGAAKSFFKGCL